MDIIEELVVIFININSIIDSSILNASMLLSRFEGLQYRLTDVVDIACVESSD
jgi:hypothetical protein